MMRIILVSYNLVEKFKVNSVSKKSKIYPILGSKI